MLLLRLYKGDDNKPYGIIGLDDKNKVFVKGLDETYYMNWLDGVIDDEEGNEHTAKDGKEFLKAVQYKLMKNVYDNELNVEGPIETDVLPDLKTL